MKELQGWINLYKPKNISSFKALNKIKKTLSLKKIGHAGTLDPLAEGLLPIGIGKATKLIPYINNGLKTYNFTIKWGIQTTTDDSDGEVLFQSNHFPKLKDINLKLKNFIGSIQQTPPKVSAVKVSGRRAYKLVRENKNFKIKPKSVYVKNLIIINHKSSMTSFNIECGKGFYVRSLARDLGKCLDTFGHILSLERVKVGKFNKETSILLDDLLKIGERHQLINCLEPSISMLDDILAYEIMDQKDLTDLSFGRTIEIDKSSLKNRSLSSVDKKNVFLYHNGDVVSVGKLIGNLFKPNKILL